VFVCVWVCIIYKLKLSIFLWPLLHSKVLSAYTSAHTGPMGQIYVYIYIIYNLKLIHLQIKGRRFTNIYVYIYVCVCVCVCLCVRVCVCVCVCTHTADDIYIYLYVPIFVREIFSIHIILLIEWEYCLNMWRRNYANQEENFRRRKFKSMAKEATIHIFKQTLKLRSTYA
jgi:hypothetical protein